MTPLAQALLNDWCSPIKDRNVVGNTEVLPQMLSAKCFEVTAIKPFLADMAGHEIGILMDSGRVFLPAPVTFLETKVGDTRVGLLCIDRDDNSFDVYRTEPSDGGLAIYRLAVVMKSNLEGQPVAYARCLQIFEHFLEPTIAWLIPTLFLINTPKLLGKTTRLPHAGLQKKLSAKMGVKGKFPLLAWTEVTIFVDPNEQDPTRENSIADARLSGQRCLHFIRAFLRWRLNRWEFVKSHTRGNAALGIKRSRYIAKPKQSRRSVI